MFWKKFQKKRGVFSENLPPEALLPPSGGCWEIRKVSWETPGRKGRFWGPIVVPRVEIWRSKVEFLMFGKVRCSENMFLWIRMMFCSHPAYPKPHFVYRSPIPTLSEIELVRFSKNSAQKSRNYHWISPSEDCSKSMWNEDKGTQQEAQIGCRIWPQLE